MKFKFQVYLAIFATVFAGLLFGRQYGPAVGVLAAFLVGNALAFSALQGPTLGVTISANLKTAKMLDAALAGFEEVILPLNALSTAFYDIPLQGNDKVVVPYYPIDSTPSRDFNGTYIFDDAEVQSKEVTIDKRKYQSLSYTSATLRRQPAFDPERHGLMKGRQLALDVVADVLSIVTVANFGAAVFTGAASTFDSDDTADLQKAADDLHWPILGRSLILNTAFYTALVKDPDVKNSPSMAITEQAMREGRVPELNGFGIRKTTGVPTNGESLAGAMVYQSAILVGFSPIQPAPEIMRQLSRYEALTGNGGVTIEFREWGNAGTDTVFRTIEANYGKDLGETAALKRIATA